MDKYGLLERSRGSSGSRKRFLQNYRPSRKRPASTWLGETQGYEPLGSAGDVGWALQTPGSCKGEGHFMGNGVGKVVRNAEGTWRVFLGGESPRGTRAGTVLLNISRAWGEGGQWPSSR